MLLSYGNKGNFCLGKTSENRQLIPDYQNRLVRLTDERLNHILRHPELEKRQTTIVETVSYPEQILFSNTDNSILLNYRFYRNTLFGDKWLCVVVKYLQNDAFIITAYLTDKIKKGEKLWSQM